MHSHSGPRPRAGRILVLSTSETFSFRVDSTLCSSLEPPAYLDILDDHPYPSLFLCDWLFATLPHVSPHLSLINFVKGDQV